MIAAACLVVIVEASIFLRLENYSRSCDHRCFSYRLTLGSGTLIPYVRNVLSFPRGLEAQSCDCRCSLTRPRQGLDLSPRNRDPDRTGAIT